MSRSGWILVGALALFVLIGGTVIVYNRRQIADALNAALERHGLPWGWGEALGTVESNLVMGAVNNTGGDAARGGAWGPTQITERTARAHGYAGPIEALTTDLELAAEWTARIAAAGKPATLEDLGAWWNAGRRTASALPAGHVTLTTYIPRLVAAYERISA